MKQVWLCGMIVGLLSLDGLLGAEKSTQNEVGLSRSGNNSLRVHHGGRRHEIRIEKAEGQRVVIKCLQEEETLTILVGLAEDPKNRGGLVHRPRDPKGQRIVPHQTSMTLLSAPPSSRSDQRPTPSQVQGQYAKLILPKPARPKPTLQITEPKAEEKNDVVYTDVGFPLLQLITDQVFDAASVETYNETVGGKVGRQRPSEILAQPGRGYQMEDLPEWNWRDSSCCYGCILSANLCRMMGFYSCCKSKTSAHILCYPCQKCAGDD